MIEPKLQYDETTERALALARSGGDGLAEARRALEAQLRADPESYGPLDAEVEVLQLLREPDLALRLLEEYIRFFPGNTDASARLAWLKWEEHNRDDALAEIKAAVARDASNLRAHWWLVKWLDEVADYPSLKRYAQKGVICFPDSAFFNLMLGRAAAHLKDESVARSAFAEALRAEPTNDEAVVGFADFLLSSGRTKEAAEMLTPRLGENASPRIRSRAITAYFRMSRNEDALAQFMKAISDPSAQRDVPIAEVFRALFISLPPEQSDALLFSALERGQLNDLAAAEFWKQLTSRPMGPGLQRLFDFIAPRSMHFPRTMTLFLSESNEQRSLSGAILRWIRGHAAEIEANTELWGSVGRFLVAQKRWPEASMHLQRYEGRAGLKPWMILLYIRTLDALGRFSDVNFHCRRALQMEPDKSEAGIRSHLAFNLALEHLASTAKVIILDLSQKGKEAAGVADIVRMIAVESLAGAGKVTTFALRKELFDEAMRCAKEVAKQDQPGGECAEVLARFRKRMIEILANTPL